jgi:hypothetical protein
MNPPLVAEMAYWITERYAIKLRREQGLPKPWSPDPIFQSVRFCNVHREDDVVTKWIREYWNRGNDPAWKFVLARMINLPESLATAKQAMLSQHTLDEMTEMKLALKANRDCGEKIFTSAYTISTCGKSMDKIDYVFDWVVGEVKKWEETHYGLNYTSCVEMFYGLTQFDGLGSFLAGQVIADMKNTKGHVLEHASDWWTFSVPGPGSLRGLSWFWFGRDDGVTPSSYTDRLASCRSRVDPLIPSYIPRISDQDFQNCLCEFSKYMKVKDDPRAHVRNRYDGL